MPNLFPYWGRTLLLLALPAFAQAQNVGINTTSPTQPLDVNGNVRVRALNGSSTRLVQVDANGTLTPAATLYPTDGAAAAPLASTITGLNNPLVALSGTLAVVLNRGTNSLSLYDLSTPNAPVLRATLTDGTNLANAQEVATNGTTVAVLCNTANGNGSDYGLTRLFTLSNGTLTLVNTLVPAPGALSAANGALTILDNRLFAAFDKSSSPGTFYVYDITTPASAAQLGTSATAGSSFTPQAAAAAGSFVAVSSMYGGVSIMNVSNPAAPVVAGSTGFPAYNGGFDVPVALSTSTLCSLNTTTTNNVSTTTLNTYSLSTAGVPTLRSTFTTAASPTSVALSGSLAYVACRVSGANVLQIIDVSGSTAVVRGTVPLDATTNNVVTTGTLTAVANGGAANDLQVFSTGRVLTVAPDGSIGSAPAPSGTTFVQNQTASTQSGGFNVSGNGTVGGNSTVSGTATVGGTLNVGPSTAPGKVLTPTTGTHNMLAVAYGVAGGNPSNTISTSGNFTVARTGTGAYTVTFTTASGLSTTNNIGMQSLFTIVNAKGFITINPSPGPGFITVNTFDISGTVSDQIFSFVIFVP